MSVTVKFLKAFHGDCIFITISSESAEERILIDGGPAATFSSGAQGELRNLLLELEEQNKTIDLVILTHIDDDHIGGLIKAFEAEDGITKLAKKVLFNSGRLIHNYFNVKHAPEKDIVGNFNQSQNTSVDQGNTLEKLLGNKGVWHDSVISQGDEYSLNHCKLHFLSPNEKELEKLLGKWESEQLSPFTSASKTDWKLGYDELLSQDEFSEDGSKTNGSSLSFILKVNEKNYLFLGDSHPSTVVEGLMNYGCQPGNPLQVEMCKVSHHGSKGNTNLELLSLIDCPKYIISTDGSRHGLPNKVTLARIHQMKPNAEILFNYAAVITDVYSTDEITQLDNKLIGLSGDIRFA
ncbi:MBL fold metallo-hydrolase [Salmonella enterica subsp. enterica serovar Westhampton]|uniref:MBL fold metallo-hydrolase n=1 Tax=Salmonella enterica TaxID=28901 RepID=A0A5U4SBW2_SALER|nr:MBL fold metallo-hydrolase [Salmonella enterica subsp. enterica serovar Aba]EBQ1674786.1 MBL fold metallo-hydrolase [Salmonella enterica]EBX8652493.1 MBL fold metallo-hydrolase [Salmonella enterica subsp. enterica serovar Westhampton]EBY6261094.1 MBL fold metallo-hydrolase [Salmonella enterica subsp. enterica serovar Warnow]EHA8895006.1 MBL fold metallo-hydrolase [Salmonella enterica subsp. enterica]